MRKGNIEYAEGVMNISALILQANNQSLGTSEVWLNIFLVFFSV